MAELQLITAFDQLPSEIHDWLASDTVASMVESWNRSFKLTGEQAYAIPCVITWIALEDLRPENCIPSLIDDFAIAADKAALIAKEVQEKIFTSVKLAMRNKLGIDIEKITHPPSPPKISAVNTAGQVLSPAARTTITAQPLVNEIKTQPVAPTPPVTPSARAQTTILEKPLVADIKKPAPPTAATPPKPKNLGEVGTIEVKKPFGFVETQPQPPAPHDMVPYKDNHPSSSANNESKHE